MAQAKLVVWQSSSRVESSRFSSACSKACKTFRTAVAVAACAACGDDAGEARTAGTEAGLWGVLRGVVEWDWDGWLRSRGRSRSLPLSFQKLSSTDLLIASLSRSLSRQRSLTCCWLKRNNGTFVLRLMHVLVCVCECVGGTKACGFALCF